ncbi:Uncharacterised protein [Candidatus Gugararchaeum adminiculabundum]|nr:Uncharacterised protein [Candidatus Gugararchaeum adminiculabundum]
MNVEKAPDIQILLDRLLAAFEFAGEMQHVNTARIIAMRSHDSKARAYARIWNFPDIWQKALDVKTYYIIEVLAHHFDPLNEEEKLKVLIHELMHIPKTFSGALVPHLCFNKRINDKSVNVFYEKFKKAEREMPPASSERTQSIYTPAE